MFIALKIKQWVAGPVESVFLQVPRALAASILALFVDFGILEFCVRVLTVPAVPAAIVGYLAGGALQYMLCSIWVFSTSQKRETSGMLPFTLLSLVGLGITWVVVAIAHDGAGMSLEFAKGGAITLAFTWNFLSRKYLLFRIAKE